ncbi:YheC/YheD family protein [Sporosarcina sp. UB5]|uniref:YheC/YheD family protein n=1 Tax=Sporosarcina sp. UB5 TaxID=3047463 RepID=UPI003D79871B
MSLYKILKSNNEINPHLVNTELFNRKNFNISLQQKIIIRPSFGSARIIVELLPNSKADFIVSNRGKSEVIAEKENVFNYINETCLIEKFTIIQNINFIGDDEEVMDIFVTVNRQVNNDWNISSISDQDGLLSKEGLIVIESRIQNIAIEAAKELEKYLPTCPTYLLNIGLTEEKWWIQDIELHFSKSKWSQHQLLTSIKKLRNYLPNTQLFTPPIFFRFIEKYKQVILKPCHGQWGIGIVQVKLSEKDLFEVHNERSKHTVIGKSELIEYLENNFLYKQSYIIQERINLATINKNVFDIRAMVQRKDGGNEWEVTAKLAKVAAKNYFVTNVIGSLLPVEKALQEASINGLVPENIIGKINFVCLKAARLLGKQYPELTRIGMDIGVDHRGKIWLFETNLVPDINIFKRFNKDLYKIITNINREL